MGVYVAQWTVELWSN